MSIEKPLKVNLELAVHFLYQTMQMKITRTNLKYNGRINLQKFQRMFRLDKTFFCKNKSFMKKFHYSRAGVANLIGWRAKILNKKSTRAKSQLLNRCSSLQKLVPLAICILTVSPVFHLVETVRLF